MSVFAYLSRATRPDLSANPPSWRTWRILRRDEGLSRIRFSSERPIRGGGGYNRTADERARLSTRAGQLLVASGKLQDPNFARAVVLIVQDDDNGAMGLVLNRPLETTVREACE